MFGGNLSSAFREENQEEKYITSELECAIDSLFTLSTFSGVTNVQTPVYNYRQFQNFH